MLTAHPSQRRAATHGHPFEEDSKMTATAQPATGAAAEASRPAYALIDTDAHHNWRGIGDIMPY